MAEQENPWTYLETGSSRIGYLIHNNVFYAGDFASGGNASDVASVIQKLRQTAKALGFKRITWQMHPKTGAEFMKRAVLKRRAVIEFIQLSTEV